MKQTLLSLTLLLSPLVTTHAELPRPNVVFIVIDNVDFAYFGKCYGGKGLTPHLDRIAEHGVKFTRADEAACVFARARIVLCHEPHAPIIAMANGTPIVHTFTPSHGPKAWMFKDIGLPEWLMEFDSTPASKMVETLLTIHNGYDTALADVKKAMAFVETKQAETMAAVARVLGV